MLHKHHIIPKHIGGSDDPANLEMLSIEGHAEAHKVLWNTHGLIQDYLAWKGLAGLIGKDEIMRLVPRFHGHHHTEETKQKIGAFHRGRKRSLETRQKMTIANTGTPKPGAIGHINNPNGRPVRQPFATCHPERKYYAIRLCCACYQSNKLKLKRIA
jgi:hypothetical protein